MGNIRNQKLQSVNLPKGFTKKSLAENSSHSKDQHGKTPQKIR